MSSGPYAIGSIKASKWLPAEESSITMLETKKKPGFFKRWLYKLSEEAWNYKQQEREERDQLSVKMAVGRLNAVEEPSLNRDRAIRFNVYVASGGRIVEVSRYDRPKDRHVDGLYVITNDQDFGREIDKIITMEHLK
jgi:hypothetical protein